MMTPADFEEGKRVVMDSIMAIYQNNIPTTTDEHAIGNVGFWTGIAYDKADRFFWQIYGKMFMQEFVQEPTKEDEVSET